MVFTLPGLFDRNFIIGFFLPAILLILGLYWTASGFIRFPEWANPVSLDSFLETVWILGLIWLTAVILIVLNRFLVRLLSGYFFPAFLGRGAKQRFKDRAEPQLIHQKDVWEGRATYAEGDGGEKLREALKDYPDRENFVLATRFGNRNRAIEVYSRVMYGLDAIPAWPRLESLLPKEFGERVSAAEAQLNFSVNVLFAAVLVIGVYSSFLIANLLLPESFSGATTMLPRWWIPVLSIPLAFFAYRGALSSLESWGEYVKSAFDLYRAQLAHQLGLTLPSTAKEERIMWELVSVATIYRAPWAWDHLDRLRDKQKRPRDKASALK